MDVTFGLHWYRFTTAVEDVEQVADSIVSVSGGGFSTAESRGAYNQPHRLVHDSGAAVYFGSKREGQPIVVDVPGEACERVPDCELVTWSCNVEGRPSRVDLAADVEPASLARSRLLEARRMFRRGACDTRMPSTSCEFMQDDKPGGGCTCYFGSRASDAFLRMYDRRGPLRLEWQWKPARELREHVPGALARYGPAGVWRQLAARCIWPVPWYHQVIAGEVADLVRPASVGSDLSGYVDALMAQHGVNLYALSLLGFTMEDVAKQPARMTAEQQQRYRRWCRDAKPLGYDPTKLKREVKRCRR